MEDHVAIRAMGLASLIEASESVDQDPADIVDLLRELAVVAGRADGFEFCEGCNSVASHSDSEGVPLCEQCWARLVDEQKKASPPRLEDCAGA